MNINPVPRGQISNESSRYIREYWKALFCVNGKEISKLHSLYIYLQWSLLQSWPLVSTAVLPYSQRRCMKYESKLVSSLQMTCSRYWRQICTGKTTAWTMSLRYTRSCSTTFDHYIDQITLESDWQSLCESKNRFCSCGLDLIQKSSQRTLSPGCISATLHRSIYTITSNGLLMFWYEHCR